MAGLDGIQNQIDLMETGFGTYNANIFSWTDEQRSRIKPLPASFNEASSVPEVDHTFLTEGGVFSEKMLQQWEDNKRHSGNFTVRNRPHPYEMSHI